MPIDTSPLPVRLRVEDYLLLDASGAFDDYAKTELIEGRIVGMNAQHRPHGMLKMEMYDRLRQGLQAICSPLRPVIEFGLALAPDSLVEPDVLLTTEPSGDGFVPLPSVALVIEVSDTSLGIPEYWVADVNAKVIHQMWAPEGEVYVEQRQVTYGEPIDAATIIDLAMETAGL
jgi:Uma2 family endonuclease